MIKLENISKKYSKDQKTIRAVDNFSLEISAGEFVALQGPSGCGKTTLLLIAGCLLRPDEGQVFLNGQEINHLGADDCAELRAKNIGFVFQQYHLIPYLNVRDNILLPVLAQQNRMSDTQPSELVASLGLNDRLHHTPAELSAGEKQRVALARALLFKPRLLLADEITGNLDRFNAEIVMRCLAEYTKSGGTVLLATHDSKAAQYASSIVMMDRGIRTDDSG